jgi:hypothetical protein
MLDAHEDEDDGEGGATTRNFVSTSSVTACIGVLSALTADELQTGDGISVALAETDSGSPRFSGTNLVLEACYYPITSCRSPGLDLCSTRNRCLPLSLSLSLLVIVIAAPTIVDLFQVFATVKLVFAESLVDEVVEVAEVHRGDAAGGGLRRMLAEELLEFGGALRDPSDTGFRRRRCVSVLYNRDFVSDSPHLAAWVQPGEHVQERLERFAFVLGRLFGKASGHGVEEFLIWGKEGQSLVKVVSAMASKELLTQDARPSSALWNTHLSAWPPLTDTAE